MTTDWATAKESVMKLALLQPEVLISGHGKFMSGSSMQEAMLDLSENFDEKAIPDHGKFVSK